MKYLMLLLIAGITISCSSSKVAVKGYKDNFIQFGKYGGVAGSYSEYQILADGRVFHRKSKKSGFIQMENVHKKDAERIFTNYESFGIGDIEVLDPGNLTYFIESNLKGRTIRQEWGGMIVTFDSKLKAYYSAINKLIANKAVIK